MSIFKKIKNIFSKYDTCKCGKEKIKTDRICEECKMYYWDNELRTTEVFEIYENNQTN